MVLVGHDLIFYLNIFRNSLVNHKTIDPALILIINGTSEEKNKLGANALHLF